MCLGGSSCDVRLFRSDRHERRSPDPTVSSCLLNPKRDMASDSTRASNAVSRPSHRPCGWTDPPSGRNAHRAVRCRPWSQRRPSCAGEDVSSASLHARLRELVRVRHSGHVWQAQHLTSTSMCHIGRTESGPVAARGVLVRSGSGLFRRCLGSQALHVRRPTAPISPVREDDEADPDQSPGTIDPRWEGKSPAGR